MKPDEYNTLLNNNITKDYKNAHHATIASVRKGEEEIAVKLQLQDRMEVTAKKEAFITLKDHKPNFRNRPSCRLINPCKSETGIISKSILDRINKKVREATGVNQWKNTDSVIEWFKRITNKRQYNFICFDIVNFYPSISEQLLDKALQFASNFDSITQDEIKIIKHAKKSLLYSKGKPWAKKDANNRTSNFDVTMGSYDGAETCDLVGLYLLSILTEKFGNNIGLYRDDGLAVFNAPKSETERIKKQLCKVFQENGLAVTIDANKKVVDFLDITLDLQKGTYGPYMKPGNTPTYVHRHSNHPPAITKNIPIAVNKRLTAISANEEIFNNAAPPYQEALRKSGYDHRLTYEQSNEQTRRRRNRSRKVVWFNPPFNMDVETKLGHKFLKIIDEAFPPNHKLAKIFNRRTLKLSYSCMPSIKTIVNSHNKEKLRGATGHQHENSDDNEGCNCQVPGECPIPGRCLATNVVYQATVTPANGQPPSTYTGVTANSFKERFRNHKSSFNLHRKMTDTELSKHVWGLRNTNTDFNITWKIVTKRTPYTNINRRCNLCLEEKFLIYFKPRQASLNKKDEIVSTCRHKSRYLIGPIG